jgi:hypothetical protein
MKVVRLSALRTGRLYPGTHFEGPSRPRAQQTCRMPRKKSPVTRPGIDPGTFRLVAQRLKHYVTPGPYLSSGAKAKLSSSISGNSVSVFLNLLDFITHLNQIRVLNVCNFVTERGGVRWKSSEPVIGE